LNRNLSVAIADIPFGTRAAAAELAGEYSSDWRSVELDAERTSSVFERIKRKMKQCGREATRIFVCPLQGGKLKFEVNDGFYR